MPAWNLALGMLLKIGQIFGTLPPGAHSCYIMRALSKDYPDGVFYFDVWPMTEPMLVITDPVIADQAALHPTVGARKPHNLLDWFYPPHGPSSSLTLPLPLPRSRSTAAPCRSQARSR